MDNREDLARFETLPDAQKRRVTKSAFLRPMNLLILILGVFASVFSWWFLPLTVVTYSLLVLLASRDPFFIRQVVGKTDSGLDAASEPSEVPPERRARWLPRGETRTRVEKSLEVYREVVSSIESSEDVTRQTLEDAIPKLHLVADRLVDIAHNREKAVEAIRAARKDGSKDEDIENTVISENLEGEIQKIDAEISETHEKLVTLRSRITYASVSDDPARHATASELGRSLDEMSLRLESLNEVSRPAENEF